MTKKWKSVLVTGGAGFMGRHILESLTQKAEKIISVDIKRVPEAEKLAGIVYKKYDVRGEKIVALIEKTQPQVIIHLAAHIHDRESIQSPLLNADQNIIGSLNIFEAARKVKGVRVVFASTGVAYGKHDCETLTEDLPSKPITPYAISKLAGERYLHFYESMYGMSAIALRFGNVYGPFQDTSAESGAIGIFASNLLRGESTFVHNDGETIRDYVYIDDAVEAVLSAAKSSFTGLVNIGSGIGTSTLELYRAVQEEVGVDLGDPEFKEEVEDLVKCVVLESLRAKKELGFSVKTSLKEGIEKTVEWYRENI